MRVAAVLLGALALAVPAGATNPRDPQQRHTAADTRLAATIALKQADFSPGWRPDKSSSAGNDAPCKSQPDESSLVQTALVDRSFTYRDGVTNIGSEVDVFRSAREARLDWKLSTLSAMKDCIASALQTGAKTRVTVSSFTRVPISKLSERTLYYRVKLVVHVAQPVTMVADLIAIGKRPRDGRAPYVLGRHSAPLEGHAPLREPPRRPAERRACHLRPGWSRNAQSTLNQPGRTLR